jgi:hypothetical protein
LLRSSCSGADPSPATASRGPQPTRPIAPAGTIAAQKARWRVRRPGLPRPGHRFDAAPFAERQAARESAASGPFPDTTSTAARAPAWRPMRVDDGLHCGDVLQIGICISIPGRSSAIDRQWASRMGTPSAINCTRIHQQVLHTLQEKGQFRSSPPEIIGGRRMPKDGVLLAPRSAAAYMTTTRGLSGIHLRSIYVQLIAQFRVADGSADLVIGRLSTR